METLTPTPEFRAFLMRLADDYLPLAVIISERVAVLAEGKHETKLMRQAWFARAGCEVLQFYEIAHGQCLVRPVPWEQKPVGEPLLISDIVELTAIGRTFLGLPAAGPSRPSVEDLNSVKETRALKDLAFGRKPFPEEERRDERKRKSKRPPKQDSRPRSLFEGR